MNEKEKSNSDSLNKSKNQSDLINRIKEIQDLPEEVIYKFIKASCSLSNTDFAKRFINAK